MRRSAPTPLPGITAIAPALIRAGTEPGTVKLIAEAEGLQGDTASIRTMAWADDVVARHFRPILEPLRLRIDMGNPEQHVEDEWIPWSATDGSGSTAQFNWGNHLVTATVTSTGAPMEWTHTWGVPGDLSFLIEDGVVVPAGAEIEIAFSGLSPGEYRLKTWHHILGERKDAPPLEIRVDDTTGQNRLAYSRFQPTFGQKIQVSAAGTGDMGDGGSKLGAAGFATTRLSVDASGTARLRMRAGAPEGNIALNGFDLIQQLTAAE